MKWQYRMCDMCKGMTQIWTYNDNDNIATTPPHLIDCPRCLGKGYWFIGVFVNIKPLEDYLL